MKIAIITDTHFGCRKDDKFFLNKQKEFLANQFFPALKQYGIKTVIHLGDLFDNRITVNINTLCEFSESYLKPLNSLGVKYYQVLGNHDCYRKDSNDINLPEVFLKNLNDYIIVKDDLHHVLGTDIILCPWINNNESFVSKIYEKIKNHKDKENLILAGHFQIEGCIMQQNQICDHGQIVDLFAGWKSVLSGHFHTPSKTGNIHYIGNPFFITWADYNDEKGFYIYDTDTKAFTHIPTEDKVFHQLSIQEATKEAVEGFTSQILRLTGSILDNRKHLEEILEILNQKGNRVEIIEESTEIPSINAALSEKEAHGNNQQQQQQTMEDIIKESVKATDNLETDKEKLSDYLIELFDDAEFNNG